MRIRCGVSISHLSRVERVSAYLGVDVRDFLYRTSFARSAVSRSNDAAISTLAQLLDELILRINDERRVEGGESVPLHCGWWVC